MDGVLLINKEEGMTSYDVVRKLKKFLLTKKVGHCGTLDPLAKGLLVVTIGKALKISRFLEADEKEYIATIKLGETTNTLDREGQIINTALVKDINENKINNVFNSLIGKQKQTPPIYSAISINGKRLYEYARENIEVNIEPRDIEIKELELIDYHDNYLKYRVVCSKGTYIRVLCDTIAKELNTIGYMYDLVRTRIGKLTLSNSYTLNNIESNNYSLIKIKDALTNFKILKLKEKNLDFAKNGNILDIDIKGEVLVIDENNEEIALYQGDEETHKLMCIRVLKENN